LLDWKVVVPGSFTVTARYNGTTGYAPSTSADFPFLVLRPTPYITVTPSNDSPALDETVDFTAALSPDPGSGTIEWLVDDEVISTVALEAGGLSHFSTAFSTPYGHLVVARFTGNDDFLPSTGGRNMYLG
uniref:hypothetical protein n=1 Tax=Escherichia coli TaxID=562 RepID=UPI003C2DA863